MRTTIQKNLYRNGQCREEVPLRNGERHGVVRTWHKNGLLATEESYRNGLPHGICRQWDETGRLLGKYRMVHGTGVQRAWHDNGQLQLEISTVRGDFCGRCRMWLLDGTLLSERIYLHGRIVSAGEYRAACAKDKTLPKLRGKTAKPLPDSPATQKRIHRVFVHSLLERPNRREARIWLQTETSNKKTGRSLGRFKRESEAAQFVEALYRAGATEVIAPDIYSNKSSDEFTDCLLVRLPKVAAKRKFIRRLCAQLQKRGLGAVQPDKDIGETHLYLSMT